MSDEIKKITVEVKSHAGVDKSTVGMIIYQALLGMGFMVNLADDESQDDDIERIARRVDGMKENVAILVVVRQVPSIVIE
jgi:hypothetical protein